MPAQPNQIVIARRFCGPPDSGNGGYTCGRLAAFLGGPAEVTLRAPPPLETPLHVSCGDAGARLLAGEREIASARPLEGALAPAPAAPSLAEVEAAAPNYEGFASHIFPGCFVCGPTRNVGGGLRIFAAPIPGKDVAACAWQPDESLSRDGRTVATEFIWAALDCPGAFGLRKPGLLMVLGRLAAQIVRVPKVGERCIVAGWPEGSEGRKHRAGTAIYAEDREPIARASEIWVEFADPQRFRAVTERNQ